MKILLRFTSTCLVLFFLFGCGNKEPGQKSGEIDYSSLGQLLIGRTNHTAVWTGSKMIVFGGFTTSTGFSNNSQVSGDFLTPNDVIGYDPASGQWSFIKTVGNAITGHTAVWTGTEMLVWGGVISDPTDTTTNGQSFVTKIGRRYNPSTNVFSRITATINAPSARQGHTALWAQPASGSTGTASMIIWGGTSDTSSLSVFNLQNYKADGSLYDPANDAWTPLPTAGAPSARAGFASVWTGTDMIIWGGVAQTNNGSTDINDGALYNLQDNVWTAMSTTNVPNVPSARHNPVAVWTGSQMIVFGGARLSQSGPTVQLGDGALYDPQNKTWTPIAAFPGFSANNINSDSTWAGVWTGTEFIVWMESSPTTYAARYKPATSTWTPIIAQGGGQTPNASGQGFSQNEFQRFSSTTIWADTKMIIWGGWANNFNNNNAGNSSQIQLYNTGFQYNPLTDTTTRTSIFIK